MDYTVHGILQARILEWVAFPFSRGIFPTQESNLSHPHFRRILYQLSHEGSPRILEWVAYPFSSGSSRPKNQTRVSCIAGRFFTNWAIRQAYGSAGANFRTTRLRACPGWTFAKKKTKRLSPSPGSTKCSVSRKGAVYVWEYIFDNDPARGRGVGGRGVSVIPSCSGSSTPKQYPPHPVGPLPQVLHLSGLFQF